MKENLSALHSEYIIDGVTMELTPAMILDSCLACRKTAGQSVEGPFGQVVDETLDPELCTCATDASKVKTYIRMVKETKSRKFPKAFADSYTRSRIANALIDALWNEGHLRLGDLALQLDWNWPTGNVGDMAAFYASVSSAAEYIDSLGLKISGYSFNEIEGEAELKVSVSVLNAAEEEEDTEDDIFGELPFKTGHPHMSKRRSHPSKLVSDAQSWLIYVPFDDCDYRLAGSLLAQALGVSGSVAPQIEDADYFIDCYEVIRELVEDNIILSGTTVGDGGLITAIKSMTGAKVGASVELADLVKATGEKDIIRLLFSEVPGAIFQIADIDYDYIDAELLLQDVAFYPLGHPLPGTSEVRVHASEKSGVQIILESIIRSQNSEGED